MEQHTLHPHPGSRKSKKRVGRGDSSGHGSFSTRGVKGQKARTGGGVRPGFEGGQTPFLRRIPKFRGFKNPCRQKYEVVNIKQLNIFQDGSTVDLSTLYDAGLTRRKNLPIKILGEGELTKKLIVRGIDAFSTNAREKLEKAGALEASAKKKA